MAQRSEDGVGKTSEMSKRLERAKPVWTRSAISIQASSRDQRCIHQAGHTEAPELAQPIPSKNFLHPAGRPHTPVRQRGSTKSRHPCARQIRDSPLLPFDQG